MNSITNTQKSETPVAGILNDKLAGQSPEDRASQIKDDFDGTGYSDTDFHICCPNPEHDDEKASCHITLRDEQILVHCFGCNITQPKAAFQALIDQGYIPSTTSWSRIWDESTEPLFDAINYLETRHIQFEDEKLPETIRVHAGLSCGEPKYDFEHETGYITMVSLVTDVLNKPTGVHRIFLDDSAESQADIQYPKKTLGNILGSHVSLRVPKSCVLHVGEGLETSFAVLGQLPNDTDGMWSAISSSNLLTVEIPDSITELHIWADKDANMHGQEAARQAAIVHHAKGRTVYLHIPSAEIPDGKRSVDFLDVPGEVQELLDTDRPFAPTAWEQDGFQVQAPFSMDETGIYVKTVADKRKKSKKFVQIRIAEKPIWISEIFKHHLTSRGHAVINYYLNQSGPIVKETQLVPSEITVEVSDLVQATKGLPDFPRIPKKQAVLRDFLHSGIGTLPLSQRQPSVDSTGWYDVHGSREFAPYSNKLRLIADGNSADRLGSIQAVGNATEWFAMFKNVLQQCPESWWTVGTILAGPLLRPCNVPTFITNLYGKSSRGKTTSTEFAASIFGNPKTLVASAGATQVAVEFLAAGFKDLCPMLDDTQKAKNKADIPTMVYQLSNEEGKTRGAKNGGLRKTVNWRCTCLINGEKSVTTFPGGNQDGIRARMLSVRSLPLEPMSRHEVDNLSALIQFNYGHLGPIWIKHLQSHYDELQGMYTAAMTTLSDAISEDSDSVNGRTLKYYGILLTALNILDDIIELDTSTFAKLKGTIIDHCKQSQKLAHIQTAALQALATVYSFYVSNPPLFAVFKEQNNHEKYAGAERRDGGLAIIRERFNTLMESISLDPAGILADWRDEGWTLHDKNRLDKINHVGGRKVRCVILKKEAIEMYLGASLDNSETPGLSVMYSTSKAATASSAAAQ